MGVRCLNLFLNKNRVNRLQKKSLLFLIYSKLHFWLWIRVKKTHKPYINNESRCFTSLDISWIWFICIQNQIQKLLAITKLLHFFSSNLKKKCSKKMTFTQIKFLLNALLVARKIPHRMISTVLCAGFNKFKEKKKKRTISATFF